MKKLILLFGLTLSNAIVFGTPDNYEVGKPGSPYPTIGSAPWVTLKAGDIVKIYARTDANGNPVDYHERLFITQSGTAGSPITVSGVADSSGRLPVIDGHEATTSSQFQSIDPVWWYLGLVQVMKNSHIVVENLQIQGTYYDPSAPSYYYDAFGAKTKWEGKDTGLYIIGADDVIARNNIITDNADGFFVNSNNYLSQNIVAQGNRIYANGRSGSYLEHNIYSEAKSMTYEYNQIGGLRPNSGGSSFKDRSTGLVFRYNVIDQCAARCMDLVDIEADALHAAYDADPSIAARSFVYGNVIVNLGNALNMIHHSSEGKGQPNAHGVVYFYDNDIYADFGSAVQWRPSFFQVDPGRTINAVNNVFYMGGILNLQSFMSDSGTLNFTGPNWYSTGIADNNDRSNAVVTGRPNLITNAQNNPGFVSAASHDFHLASGSQLIGTGGPLDPIVLPTYDVTRQFLFPSGMARTSVLDIGAYEYLSGGGGQHVYYVSPTGNDNNPGTSASPWLTIQNFGNYAQAGDTLLVRAGTYAGAVFGWDGPNQGIYSQISGTAANPIIIKADPAAAAGSVIINSRSNKTRVAIDLEPGCDYVTISGFTVDDTGHGISDSANRGSGIKATGQNDVISNNTVLNITYGFGITSNAANNITIKNNTVSGTQSQGNTNYGHGIYVAGGTDGAVVMGNNIHDNEYTGLQFNGDPDLVTNAYVANNRIYNNGGQGINADGLRTSRLENNIIANYQTFGITLFQIDASGPSINNVIVNNTFVAGTVGAAAVRIKSASVGNIVFNNILLGGNGIFYRLSADSMSGFMSDYNVVGNLVQADENGNTQTLAQWQAANEDTHSIVATAAQLFIDAAGGDFRLTSASLAKDIGVATFQSKTAPTVDFLNANRPYNSIYDLGAYEYGASGGGPINQRPTVSAGSDATITLPSAANLDGTVTDDGLPNPPAKVTTTWSKVSGPGTVTFANAAAVDTTATFSQSGTYVLRLTASDSALSTSDDVTITVNSSSGGGGGGNNPPGDSGPNQLRTVFNPTKNEEAVVPCAGGEVDVMSATRVVDHVNCVDGWAHWKGKGRSAGTYKVGRKTVVLRK